MKVVENLVKMTEYNLEIIKELVDFWNIHMDFFNIVNDFKKIKDEETLEKVNKILTQTRININEIKKQAMLLDIQIEELQSGVCRNLWEVINNE